jgi:hypothetical protein
MYNNIMYLSLLKNIRGRYMARRIYTVQQKERLLQRSQEEFKAHARVVQLYNYTYRRSTFFRFSVVLRALTFILSFYILNFNSSITSTRYEVLHDKKVEQFVIGKTEENSQHKDIILHTAEDHTYLIGFMASKPDVFLKGDTLRVISNIFGKKTFIAKTNSDHLVLISKYRRLNNYLIFVCFISFGSLLVFDGYDYLFRLTVKLVLLIDISAILLYLFI